MKSTRELRLRPEDVTDERLTEIYDSPDSKPILDIINYFSVGNYRAANQAISTLTREQESKYLLDVRIPRQTCH